ncbi:MAG: ABC transporter permease [Lachnospiraceae bacterium]|nr:ABC transporter permease [Lachnospiraceae bacterium]
MLEAVLKKKKIIISAVVLLLTALAAVVVLHVNPEADRQYENIKKVISVCVIVSASVFFALKFDKIVTLPVEIWQNRRLILKLAGNDFKRRYAGSYMGAVWAFIQPLVTIGLYYFVFGTIMKGARTSGSDVPFVLFLTCGMVPWFFFSEALSTGTSALLEYSYLVKKVVFKISVLPIIKVVAALMTHAFFVVLLMIIAVLCGYYPNIYWIQMIYYTFCAFVLALAICYTTCSVIVFIRDLGQLIGVMLQILVWATPIMWNIDQLAGHPMLVSIMKLNPCIYIVTGYRDAIYGRIWFFERFFSTVYFWVITAILFGIGAIVYKRLKPHFADVL